MTLHEGIRESRLSSSFQATSVRKLGSPISLRFSSRVEYMWISKGRFLTWLLKLSPVVVAACWGWDPITVEAHISGLTDPPARPTLTLIDFRIYVGENCEVICSMTTFKVHLRRQEVQLLTIQHHLSVPFLTSTWAPILPAVPALSLTLQAHPWCSANSSHHPIL